MRISLAVGGLLAAAVAIVAAVQAQTTQVSANLRSTRPLVLVELYQSQGCSSCPPANANINAIADRPDLVALSFGVTYWDYLGWRDSFASPEFTQRQWDYARFNRRGNVATPQVWINGRRTIVGSNRGELEASIRAATSDGPTLAIRDGRLDVGAARAAGQSADVWVANYDPRSVEVAISAGENDGRTLPHRNIVRQLTRIGHWQGMAGSFALPHAAPGLATAAFLQEGRGGPVIAATKASRPPASTHIQAIS